MSAGDAALSHINLFKFIIVGDSGVGKSCLLLQFIDKRFEPKHDLTIGLEFGTRVINVGTRQVKLQIWDTAGQECYRSIIRGYYRNSAGALLVYDITSRASFERAEVWLNEARDNSNRPMSIMLVGNKVDMGAKREVTTAEGQEFAEKHGLLFIETSAKDRTNIDKAFSDTAAAICDRIEKDSAAERARQANNSVLTGANGTTGTPQNTSQSSVLSEDGSAGFNCKSCLPKCASRSQT